MQITFFRVIIQNVPGRARDGGTMVTIHPMPTARATLASALPPRLKSRGPAANDRAACRKAPGEVTPANLLQSGFAGSKEL